MDFWQYTPFLVLFGAALLLSFFLYVNVILLNHVKGKTQFTYMILSIIVWLTGYILEISNTQFSFKLVMLRVQYFGIIGTVLFWFFFVAAYTNSDKWLRIKTQIILLIIPFITLLEVLFVRHHNFFYQTFEPDYINNLAIIKKVYGLGFYIWSIYSYLLILGGAYILFREIIKMPEIFKGQLVSHIVIIISVLVPNFVYIIGYNPIYPYDPTCLTFVIVSLIYLYILKRHSFLNIAPVAYNIVFKNVNSGVIIIDKKTCILDMNPSAEKILRIKNIDAVGKKLSGITNIFNEIYDKIISLQEYKHEIETDAESTTYELQTTVLSDNKGKDNGRILMLYDITKRKLALQELNAYARTVAHNLKTPMIALDGFTDFLKDEECSIETQKEFLQIISNSSKKMNNIIDGLLLLSKIRTIDEIKVTTLNTKEIITNSLTRLEEMIKQYNGEITYPVEWPDAIGYSLWVEEIWVNFISNALKYGGTPPVIEIGAEKCTEGVKFWIKDNGNGIDKEEQSKLFREFTRLEETKEKEGHGLGLSIIKRIVNKLNGKTGVESIKGKGSTFYFILPETA